MVLFGLCNLEVNSALTIGSRYIFATNVSWNSAWSVAKALVMVVALSPLRTTNARYLIPDDWFEIHLSDNLWSVMLTFWHASLILYLFSMKSFAAKSMIVRRARAESAIYVCPSNA